MQLVMSELILLKVRAIAVDLSDILPTLLIESLFLQQMQSTSSQTLTIAQVRLTRTVNLQQKDLLVELQTIEEILQTLFINLLAELQRM